MNRTFSKIWIIVILLVLIAGGILAWQYFATLKKETGEPQEEVKELKKVKTPEEKAKIQEVVFGFYQCYIKIAEETNLSLEGRIEKCDKLEKSYKEILSLKGFFLIDPILWAQALPFVENLQVSDATVDGNSASVFVTFFPEWPNHKLKVYLLLINNEWKIVDIEDMNTGLSKRDLPSMTVQEENEPSDDTTDWRIYRNEKYGYEVKYPSDWEVKWTPDEYHVYFNKENCRIEISEISKRIYERAQEEGDKTPRVIKRDEVELKSFLYNNFYSQKNNKSFKFSFKDKLNDLMIGELAPLPIVDCKWNFYQMLLTFRFLKIEEITKDETADWKIYRNEEYGLEVKYPKEIYLKENVYLTPVISMGIREGDYSLLSIYIDECVVCDNLEDFNIEEALARKDYYHPLGEGPPTAYDIVIFRNRLRYHLVCGDLLHEFLCDKILSTFRFLE